MSCNICVFRNSPSQTVVMKLRVTNMNYTQNLTDRESEEFQVLEAKFMQVCYPLNAMDVNSSFVSLMACEVCCDIYR